MKIQPMVGITSKTTIAWTALFLILTALGGAWDVWWHVMVGRESFWEPPHIMLYAGIFGGLTLATYAWRVFKNPRMKWVALALIGIPLFVAPFDEIWHAIFGFEDLRSVWIVWSPPHVTLVLAIAAAIGALFSPLRELDDDSQRTLGAALVASLMFLGAFLTVPLSPEGQFHIMGWWGTWARAGVYTALFLWGTYYLGTRFAALSIAAWYSVFLAVGSKVGVRSPDILMNPHFDYPTWLSIFALFAIAFVITILREHFTLAGFLGGATWGAVLYGGGMSFAPTEFAYVLPAALLSITSAALGGTFGALIAKRLRS
jgi:hypothetical protein